MRARTSRNHHRTASDRIQRSCAAALEQLEKRFMLSSDGAELLASAAVSAQLDPQSDTGISSSDGITSDNTPALQVNLNAPTTQAPQTFWAVASNENGFTYVELNNAWGPVMATGRQFTDAWGTWQWQCGSAVGDGRLYVAAPKPENPNLTELRTYDLTTLTRVSSFDIAEGNLPGGLAYMNGKLYVANSGGFLVIDPATGAVLDSKGVFRSDWTWSGTAQSLAANPSENVLYAVTWDGALTKIDAATGLVLAQSHPFGSSQGWEFTGAAYSQGRLYISGNGPLYTFDADTLQLLSTSGLPGGAWMYVSLAGDGEQTAGSPFYRVYDNGVLISSDSESDATFQTPTLTDGPHSLEVNAYSAGGGLLGTSRVNIEIDTQSPALRPAAPALDSASDTGLSSSDRVTSDNTPLIRVTPQVEGTFWVVSSTQTDGLVFTEVDSRTGQRLGSFADPNLADHDPGHGAAIADGVLYIATWEAGTSRLRTYDVASGQLLGNVALGTTVSGLAYLNGKLYGAAGDLMELDPQTGAVLSRRSISYPGGPWVGTGVSLAADNESGVLYSISFDGRLVKIDPASSVPLSVTPLINAPSWFDGLGFSGGRLIGSQVTGLLSTIDPSSGQVTQFAQLPQALWTIYGVAGEGQDKPLHYRVYSDGVQISGGYEQGNSFVMPQLADGQHVITIVTVDAAGNVSEMSDAITLTIDTTAPERVDRATVDSGSDTGVSSSDGITSDTTPLLNIPTMRESSVWLVNSPPDGLLFIELDPATGAEISRFTDSSVRTTSWAIGAAMGDGVIYVAGAEGELQSLRTYSLATRMLVRSVPLAQPIYGLAYLDGKLYAADSGLMEIDPTTGAVLSRRDIYYYGGPWVGTGMSLAADNAEGVLYSITWAGQLVKIDPAASTPLAVIDNVDPQRSMNGLAFTGGNLIACTFDANLVRIDPSSGEVTPIAPAPGDGWCRGLAGEGAVLAYYRVFADGVQVSGDYETTRQFQMPQLSQGSHIITVRAVDRAGNLSPASQALSLSIDTTPPSRPSAPALNASSDSGISSTDRITADSTPLLNIPQVVGEPMYYYYRVFADGVQVSGDHEQGPTFEMPQLADGTHLITIAYVDVAGNVSPVSEPLSLRIDTVAPGNTTAVALAASSDTGISSTDRVTSDATPLLNIPLAEGYYRVFSDGVQVSGDYQSAGQFQLPELSDGPHIITIRRVDAAGNLSPASEPLTITIDTTASARPGSPTLDSGSDTGVSSSDGITSDTTPLLNIPLPVSASTIWQASGQPLGLLFVERDPVTGAEISRFTDASFYSSGSAIGAAAGDGVLYVSVAIGDLPSLRTYNLATRTLISSVPLDRTMYGLAYLGGRLYAADAGLIEIDPATGAVLSRREIFLDDGVWVGTGQSLTADNNAGVLYSITWRGQLVKIDPASSTPLAVISDVDPQLLMNGLAYARGNLIAITYSRKLLRIDPHTGQVSQIGQLSADNGSYHGLAGEGWDAPTYYRVFCDGVQISGDYETAGKFQMPELSSGSHIITVKYVDSAGNVSAMSEGLRLKIDTTPPERPGSAVLDSGSDTGVSSSDGITSDTTPLLNVPLVAHDTSVWLVNSLYNGLLFVELDPATGAEISRFIDSSVQGSTWAIGAAAGDGVIYVAGVDGDLRSLRTYNLATRTLVSSVALDRPIYGLAYLGGRLYAADSGLLEIDPATGAVLSRTDIFLDGWVWVGTGTSLTADNDEGVLYSISWAGQLVKIDPASPTALAVINNVDPQRLINALAFAGGNLIACTYEGNLLRINPSSGAITPIAHAPADVGYYHGLAGEGQDLPTYYRVFSDGVQISGDYETAGQFQMPELSPGTHIITVKYVDAAGNVSQVGAPKTIRIFSDAPIQPGAPALDPSSDGGYLGDHLTNDNTPLVQIPTMAGDDSSIVRIIAQQAEWASGLPGGTYLYWFDTQTQTILSQSRIGTASQWDWAHGAALADGLLYVINTVDTNTYPHRSVLQAFNAENGAFIYEVTLDTSVHAASLAYLDGKLYVGAAGLLCTVDPLTGEVLSSVYAFQWDPPVYPALGSNLTGAADLGRLFAIDYSGYLMSIDPTTGESIVLPYGDRDVSGMAYMDGELITITYNGLVRHLDPQTGAILSSYQFPGQPGLYSAMAGEGAAEPGSLTYFRVFADGVQVSGDYEQGGSFVMPQLADGEHLITIVAVDAAGNVSAMSEPLTLTVDATAPVVQEVIINDGSAQRSMVNQVTVVFSEPVILAADAIRVTLFDGSAIPGTQVTCSNPSGDGRTYVLTFSGEGVTGGSLADGIYVLSVSSGADLAGNQVAEFTYGFHRLFGDGAGDGSISREDLETFIDSLSARYGSDYTWYFDFDASGRVTGADMSDFIERYILGR